MKKAALKHLRLGAITVGEAALWCAVSRQRIHAMCAAAGFDPVKTRRQRVEAIKRREDRPKKRRRR